MVRQYEIYWVELNPTKGSEINKTRPGIILTPNESNKHLQTVIIAPLTSTIRNFPMRLEINLEGRKSQIALDQIRAVDKSRLRVKAGELSATDIIQLKSLLKEYLID